MLFRSVQGFFFARPVSPQRITEILDEGQAWVAQLLPPSEDA